MMDEHAAPGVVVIVNWNSADWLAQAVRALRQQTWRRFRVVVVDNASSDLSLEKAQREWPGIDIIREPENIGFAAANNHAFRVAGDAPWIALLNPDAIPRPDWLEKLLRAARDYPHYACFGSRQLVAGDEQRLDGVGDACHVSGLAWRMGHGAAVALAPAEPREIFSPCAAAALYRREALEAVHGFEARFFCYLEDVDLGFRLRLAGYRALYVADAVVSHGGAVTTRRHSDFYTYHSHRNIVWLYARNMPSPLVWRYLPAHIAMNLWAVIHFALRGQLRIILRAKWHALRELPAVLRQRAQIQAGRVATVAALRVSLAGGWPRRGTLVSLPPVRPQDTGEPPL